MKILAIEASGPVAGCAVLEDGRLIADYNVQYKKKHAQSLVPMMEEVRRMLELDLQTVDAIAIAEGPGSFTGLRIGAATAKGAALAMNTPIIPVPTVDAIAYNLYATDALICPLMDARRQQVYTGIYAWTPPGSRKGADASQGTENHFVDTENGKGACSEDTENGKRIFSENTDKWKGTCSTGTDREKGACPGSAENEQGTREDPRFEVLRPQCVIPVAEILEDLNSRGKAVIFLGDGVPVSRDTIDAQLQVPYSFAPPHLDRQRAAAVAALAWTRYRQKGQSCMVSADDFRPTYLRLAQAEQEHSEKRSFSLLL